MFVLDGLIAVNRTEGGFLYKLTVAGRKYIGTLESDYKDQYLARGLPILFRRRDEAC